LYLGQRTKTDRQFAKQASQFKEVGYLPAQYDFNKEGVSREMRSTSDNLIRLIDFPVAAAFLRAY